MNNLCEKIHDQLADYILGILSAEEINVINEHMGECLECRQYIQALEDENRILMQFGEDIKQTMTVRQDKVIEALRHSMPTVKSEIPSLWRMIMTSTITKAAAAAMIVVAILLLINFLDRSVVPAYAVEQTIDAIREVKTVQMQGEFYKQGKFQCWMRFDGDPDIPTHMWLGLPGIHQCKICSPEGVFGLNKRTNYVHFASRDERGKTWVIRFGSFFRDAVEAAGKMDSVDIYNEKEFIVVHVKTTKREQKFFVDPETKLPVRFSTIREDAPMEMMRKTLAVKNLEWIRYNQEPPEGIFDLPADAKIVEDGYDCWVDPDSGLVADGITQQQACRAIVEQTGRALIDLDIDTLCKLDLFFLQYNPDLWDQVRQMKEAGQWVDELVITGDVYEEKGLWYVPCEIRMSDGRSEVQTTMIKFYEMEGKSICVIIGSKEKGVMD